MSKFKSYENPQRKVFDLRTEELFKKKIQNNFKLKAMTENQQYYIDTIEDCQYTVCGGMAGTGKSIIAIAKGFEYLRNDKYKKLVLIRPLQECGRQLGFFPGEKEDKLAPHMLAFTGIFDKISTKDEINSFIKDERLIMDTCELMRGVTWDDSYVVIDEAQNCTLSQLKMLMTRLGQNSKMVIVGDDKQTDLWRKEDLVGSRSPLAYLMDVLYDEDDDIGVLEMEEKDVVRNKLIGKIIKLIDGKKDYR